MAPNAASTKQLQIHCQSLMYSHRLPKNDNEEFMKHERYVEILNSIGRNTHEAQALIRKLEYRKEAVKKVCISKLQGICIHMDTDLLIQEVQL